MASLRKFLGKFRWKAWDVKRFPSQIIEKDVDCENETVTCTVRLSNHGKSAKYMAVVIDSLINQDKDGWIQRKKNEKTRIARIKVIEYQTYPTYIEIIFSLFDFQIPFAEVDVDTLLTGVVGFAHYQTIDLR